MTNENFSKYSEQAEKMLMGPTRDYVKLAMDYTEKLMEAQLEAAKTYSEIGLQQARAALIEHLSRFRRQGGLVAFDSNYRPRLWPDRATAQQEIAAFWSVCDVALPSLDDEIALFGDTGPDEVIARLLKTGVTRGALKRGAVGPLAIGHQTPETVFAPADRVVDTTAAGDSFNGAYIAALLKGLDPAQCLQAGHYIARKIVAVHGAIAPRDDVAPVTECQ
jgi:2-dehydro-3-deoxygluconokinase